MEFSKLEKLENRIVDLEYVDIVALLALLTTLPPVALALRWLIVNELTALELPTSAVTVGFVTLCCSNCVALIVLCTLLVSNDNSVLSAFLMIIVLVGTSVSMFSVGSDAPIADTLLRMYSTGLITYLCASFVVENYGNYRQAYWPRATLHRTGNVVGMFVAVTAFWFSINYSLIVVIIVGACVLVGYRTVVHHRAARLAKVVADLGGEPPYVPQGFKLCDVTVGFAPTLLVVSLVAFDQQSPEMMFCCASTVVVTGFMMLSTICDYWSTAFRHW